MYMLVPWKWPTAMAVFNFSPMRIHLAVLAATSDSYSTSQPTPASLVVEWLRRKHKKTGWCGFKSHLSNLVCFLSQGLSTLSIQCDTTWFSFAQWYFVHLIFQMFAITEFKSKLITPQDLEMVQAVNCASSTEVDFSETNSLHPEVCTV